MMQFQKWTKRLMTLTAGLLLCFGLALTSQAADLYYDLPDGRLTFDAATGTITKCDATVVNAVIPSEIQGVPVTALGAYAFYWPTGESQLESVTIPDTVTTLGRSVFDTCSKLTSVTIPDSVTTVEQGTFQNCTGLTQVTIGGGMTTIPREMFAGCKALTEVTISDHIRSIGYDAFSYTGLTELVLPDSVTSISSTAFDNCHSLKSVYLPNSVTSIGRSAFSYCTNLTEVRLPNCLTTIPDAMFDNCQSLTEITIPNSVTTMGSSIFRFCTNLKTVTIPDSVTEIGSGVFYGCDNMTDVYYGGDAAQWSRIEAGSLNEGLDQANIHFSEPVAGFTDVNTGDYFGQAVQWAVNTGVTSGTSATTFSPDKAVTRGQAVTFLWRAAGSPEPSTTVSPFTDVADPAQYYYKAVLWAVEQGIANGVSASRFSPNSTLAYDQIFTFLCRAAGGTMASGDWSAAAVEWAEAQKLTDGFCYTAKGACPRADLVYCLWKQMA